MHKISILFFISIFGCLTSCTQEKSDVTHSKTAINPHYLDPYCPQIHYSCDTGWLSDPNGLFYQEGVWHLMFQETSNRHGMNTFTNWGHAASTNLLHWDHLPVALEVGNRIRFYAGSVYVDNLNASGLGKDGQIPVLAYYTTHPTKEHLVRPNQNMISLGYSLDNGRSCEYRNRHIIDNPSVPTECDPSVFWHEPSREWVMATVGVNCIRFYSSKKLLDWSFESETLHGSSRECPDLNMMTVAEMGEQKVVLITSKHGVPNSSHGTAYHVGTFDGSSFHPEDTTDARKWLHWGSDFYAGITYSNVPDADGRMLLQSWFGWPVQFHRGFVQTSKFAGTMNLIRELTLHRDGEGNHFLRSNPIYEYKKLRIDSVQMKEFILSGRKNIREDISSHEPMEIILDATAEKGATFGLRLKNDFREDYIFKYDDWRGHVMGDRTMVGTLPRHYTNKYNDLSRMPYKPEEQRFNLRLYWDVSTFEVFVDGGKESFSQLFYPREPFTDIEIFTEGGQTTVESLRIYDLKSMWAVEQIIQKMLKIEI